MSKKELYMTAEPAKRPSDNIDSLHCEQLLKTAEKEKKKSSIVNQLGINASNGSAKMSSGEINVGLLMQREKSTPAEHG